MVEITSIKGFKRFRGNYRKQEYDLLCNHRKGIVRNAWPNAGMFYAEGEEIPFCDVVMFRPAEKPFGE